MAPSSGGSGLDLFISNIARWLSSLPCSAGGDTFGIAALSNQLAHGCGTSPFPVSDQSEPDIVHVGNNVDDPKSPSFAMGSKADGDAQSCSFDGRCGEPQPMEDDLNEVQMTRDAGQNLEHYKLDDGSYNQVRVASFDQIAARGCFSGNWFPLRAYQEALTESSRMKSRAQYPRRHKGTICKCRRVAARRYPVRRPVQHLRRFSIRRCRIRGKHRMQRKLRQVMRRKGVPSGTRLVQQVSDGNCLYRSVASALRQEHPGLSHRRLRRDTAAFLKAQPHTYIQDWYESGCLGPGGDICESWSHFTAAICRPGAYAGLTELAALCDRWQFRAIVFSGQDQSRFCVGKRWVECTKCFLWRDNHLDYLAPVRDSYPPQCLHYREKPQRCFLVGGGRSETTGAHELLQGLGLKEMIRELVIAEVRAAIKEAFAGLGGTESLVAAAFNQAPKLEGRGKGAGNAVPNAAPANTVVGNRDSTDDANLNSKFEDKSQPRSKGNRKGNHEGATSQFVSHDADLGKWITVRPHKANADVEVQLRQQDWDDPLINYSSLASKLEECSSQPFRAVVHCQPQNIETAKVLLKGSGKTHSVLLIEFAKDRKTKGKGKDTDDKTNLRQRLPVKAGNFVKFVDGFVHQVFSDGVQVSKPKGLTVTTKLTPKKTSVLFCKIPKEFVSSEEWQKFKDNPRIEIAKWASKLQVQCVDAFNWSEERLPQGRQQIFGAIRVAEKDGPTLLAGSGTSAVFVQAPKAESTEQYVQWVERNKGEPNHAYLARVMRAKGALGLAFRGQSLGSRHHADANTPITRIWILEGTPREVDMEQAKTVLQPVFNDVTIIRQINRGSTRSFVFRAACARGNEVDLIPIVVELSQGPITAWAKVAPPRDDKVKQRPIKGGSLPCIDHKSSLDPVSVIVELPCDKGNEASAQDDQSTEDKPQAQAKETSAPKRQKALVRQPPPGTKLIPQEKDGNCLYHTVVAALNSERKDKTFHHTELRARVVAHMKAHPEWYKADWESDGKKGPDGNPCKDWDCFLEQVAKPGSYSCDLELRALCRLCQFKAVLVPEDPNFSVVAYGKKWKSKTHCIFYSHRHFDYLSPDGDDKYPDELLNVTCDPNGGFLVGGVSELHTDYTSSRGAPSVQNASLMPHRAADLRTETSVTDSVRERRQRFKRAMADSAKSVNTKKARPNKSQPASTLQGEAVSGVVFEEQDVEPQAVAPTPAQLRMRRLVFHKLPASGLFQCSLCAFVRKAKTQAQYSEIRYRHCTQYHNGAGLPGKPKRKSVLSKVQPKMAYAWQCKFCDQGILNSVRAEISKPTFKDAKRKHRQQVHPRISDKTWQAATNAPRQSMRIMSINRFAAAKCHSDTALAHKGHSKFSWPFAKRPPKSKAITGIMILGAWKCGTCGGCDRPSDFKFHLGNKQRCCPENARKNSVRRLKELATLHKWGKAHPTKHGIPMDVFESVFAGAQRALTVPSPEQPSSA